MVITKKEYLHVLTCSKNNYNINEKCDKKILKESADKIIDSELCKVIIGSNINTPISKKPLKNRRKTYKK